jgi:hypothetical protein
MSSPPRTAWVAPGPGSAVAADRPGRGAAALPVSVASVVVLPAALTELVSPRVAGLAMTALVFAVSAAGLADVAVRFAWDAPAALLVGLADMAPARGAAVLDRIAMAPAVARASRGDVTLLTFVAPAVVFFGALATSASRDSPESASPASTWSDFLAVASDAGVVHPAGPVRHAPASTSESGIVFFIEFSPGQT